MGAPGGHAAPTANPLLGPLSFHNSRPNIAVSGDPYNIGQVGCYKYVKLYAQKWHQRFQVSKRLLRSASLYIVVFIGLKYIVHGSL